MNRTFLAAGALALSFAWTLALAADGASTSPGTNSLFVSAYDLTLPASVGTATLLSGQIKKGKRRTVIAFEMTAGLFGHPTLPLYVEIWPAVNGYTCADLNLTNCNLGPVTFARAYCPPTSSLFTCNVTGTAWFDLDAAELAHPGAFVNQPLTIELRGHENTGIGTVVKASLTARVVKK